MYFYFFYLIFKVLSNTNIKIIINYTSNIFNGFILLSNIIMIHYIYTKSI